MIVKFRNQLVNCRALTTTPGRFKIGDLVIGPDGMILEVATVQTHVPIWESNYHSKCVVIFRTEDDDLIPVHGITGPETIYRPRQSKA